jgi:hypothetical protein
VHALETGTRQPDLRTIHQLARTLGVAFWALYEEPGTVLPGAVTLLAELYDIDAVIGDDPEAMVAAVRIYLATQPADDSVTKNLSRIAERLDRFARAMCAAFPPREKHAHTGRAMRSTRWEVEMADELRVMLEIGPKGKKVVVIFDAYCRWFSELCVIGEHGLTAR